MTSGRVPVRVAVILALTACLAHSSDKKDWEKAKAAGTEPAYSKYLRDHGSSQHAAEARQKLREIWWKSAETENTWEAFSKLARMEEYPKADRKKAAGRAKEISDSEWDRAVEKNTEQGYQEFLKRNPEASKQVEVKRLIAKLKLEAVKPVNELELSISENFENTTPARPLKSWVTEVLRRAGIAVIAPSGLPDAGKLAISVADVATPSNFGTTPLYLGTRITVGATFRKGEAEVEAAHMDVIDPPAEVYAPRSGGRPSVFRPPWNWSPSWHFEYSMDLARSIFSKPNADLFTDERVFQAVIPVVLNVIVQLRGMKALLGVLGDHQSEPIFKDRHFTAWGLSVVQSREDRLLASLATLLNLEVLEEMSRDPAPILPDLMGTCFGESHWQQQICTAGLKIIYWPGHKESDWAKAEFRDDKDAKAKWEEVQNALGQWSRIRDLSIRLTNGMGAGTTVAGTLKYVSPHLFRWEFLTKPLSVIDYSTARQSAVVFRKGGDPKSSDKDLMALLRLLRDDTLASFWPLGSLLSLVSPDPQQNLVLRKFIPPNVFEFGDVKGVTALVRIDPDTMLPFEQIRFQRETDRYQNGKINVLVDAVRFSDWRKVGRFSIPFGGHFTRERPSNYTDSVETTVASLQPLRWQFEEVILDSGFSLPDPDDLKAGAH